MSAAEVLAVATPSWNTKGFFSAKDLLLVVAAAESAEAVDAVVVDEDDSDFVTDSLAAFVFVVLVLRRTKMGERFQSEVDDLLETTLRLSIVVASILI